MAKKTFFADIHKSVIHFGESDDVDSDESVVVDFRRIR